MRQKWMTHTCHLFLGSYSFLLSFPFSLSARTFLHFLLSLRNHRVKNDLTPEVMPSLREHDPSSVWRQGPWLLDLAWPDLVG